MTSQVVPVAERVTAFHTRKVFVRLRFAFLNSFHRTVLRYPLATFGHISVELSKRKTPTGTGRAGTTHLGRVPQLLVFITIALHRVVSDSLSDE